MEPKKTSQYTCKPAKQAGIIPAGHFTDQMSDTCLSGGFLYLRISHYRRTGPNRLKFFMCCETSLNTLF